MSTKFENTILGDSTLCAWAVAPTVCRIQTRDPEIARTIERLPDCRRVGYNVGGGFFRLFTIPRTLSWVRKNVLTKRAPLFPNK